VWWILSLLLSLLAWAAWYVWDLELWIPIAVTALLFALALALFIWRRVSAARAGKRPRTGHRAAGHAASAERAARAARRDPGPANAGAAGHLGPQDLEARAGKRGGAAALYSLPWYVIIGPPGAGKTTALKHSGLVFPFAGAGGGAVRGVGGTRNCDWWFTNEAILLDTAGRYTTQADDRDEWIAFLQMLLRYRKQPINGVLVAVSITDLIDANEPQIEAMGKNIRARIDEVMTQLHMVVPVYVLFTKCDLIAGFSEFFGDLRKTERAQAWGATLRLDAPKTDPGKLFDAEFDLLAQKQSTPARSSAW
jgi:type VI secretion system protein ImpL